jgi:MFS superfamily sulfate permease-like transporter
MLGVMLLGTLRGILVAIIVSVVALAAQVADPPVYEVRRKRGTASSARCRPSIPTTSRSRAF